MIRRAAYTTGFYAGLYLPDRIRFAIHQRLTAYGTADTLTAIAEGLHDGAYASDTTEDTAR